ncbi:MAG: hypothetical protein CVU87_08095 [Firmicutes bacterium HGW-Firmicutes-12]|jgi:hypothetical protein|nr:MAG: hypothetical protein CVU87_08095 [Firmicutes bacterium HGW-Firmicutes-12]
MGQSIYKITIIEKREKGVVIAANTEKDAIKTVTEDYESEKYILDKSNVVTYGF